MVTDLLEQMNRKQLETVAMRLKIKYSQYPSKFLLVEAIRAKRAEKK